MLVEGNAAEMILQQDLNPSMLKKTIEQLIFDDDKLTAIKENCKKFYFKNAANEIAKSALELINSASAGQSEI